MGLAGCMLYRLGMFVDCMGSIVGNMESMEMC
jgi:hypothetical protein